MKTVHYVSAHLFTMSPVYTPLKGEGLYIDLG